MAARTALVPITLPTQYSVTPVALTFTAPDTTNFNSAPMTGSEFIIIKNGAGSNTFTATSTGDEIGRTGNIAAAAVAATTWYVTQVFPINGWQQTDQNLYFQGSAAAVTLAFIRIPNFIV